MAKIKQKISPCLWFDTQAEEAANFYTSIFDESRIKRVSHYGKAGHETHGREAGSVMTVEFELAGQTFIALNGGPHHKFNEAISFQVACATQEEIDRLWCRLCDGGEESRCGWLKDKYGVSWQVVPSGLPELLTDADHTKTERVMAALMMMKKLDVAALQVAYSGQA
jgi:predicted 3-demethylubiquinone-9 3-methyltransferase (glyoxalase superfamily)